MPRLCLIAQVLFCCFISALQAGECRHYSTYFSYPAEGLEELQHTDSELAFSTTALKKWDGVVAAAFKEAPSSLQAMRVYTYLYVAQMEGAKLTYDAKCRLAGSLDPLSYSIISLFIPDLQKTADYQEDPYSLLLAKLVTEPLRARMEEEDQSTHEFTVPAGMESNYVVGLNVAKWTPWYATPATRYWPPAPPKIDDPFWKGEIDQLRVEGVMTDEKRKAIQVWAGMIEPGKSDWREIANAYLFSHDIPLLKTLQVRGVLMMGLYDATIVSFTSKYHYLLIRPSVYDPTLHHEIPVPKHPSYPSNHSVTGGASATILAYFFPSDAAHWYDLENTSGLSRRWAGIHYPIDDTAGRETGKRVADRILTQISPDVSP